MERECETIPARQLKVRDVPNASLGDDLIFARSSWSELEVRTALLLHDFSQLPVFSGKDRWAKRLEGTISWKSLAQAQLNANRTSLPVERAFVVQADDGLFEMLRPIMQNDYVLVESAGKIDGLVTTYDAVEYLGQAAEPFLLARELECWLSQRTKVLQDDQIAGVLNRERNERSRGSETLDRNRMTLGDFHDVLENEDCWDACQMMLDRKRILPFIKSAQSFRNALVHGRTIEQGQLQHLRSVVRVMRQLGG